jgi:hypothetical protein
MMRRILIALFAVATFGTEAAPAAEPILPLHVVYVGGAKTDRAAHFERFLKQHFRQVTIFDRDAFQPSSAASADVVLLDWSQSDSKLDKTSVPLGKLESWSKPTVLLNHAGLLAGGHWEIIGGAG